MRTDILTGAQAGKGEINTYSDARDNVAKRGKLNAGPVPQRKVRKMYFTDPGGNKHSFTWNRDDDPTDSDIETMGAMVAQKYEKAQSALKGAQATGGVGIKETDREFADRFAKGIRKEGPSGGADLRQSNIIRNTNELVGKINELATNNPITNTVAGVERALSPLSQYAGNKGVTGHVAGLIGQSVANVPDVIGDVMTQTSPDITPEQRALSALNIILKGTPAVPAAIGAVAKPIVKGVKGALKGPAIGSILDDDLNAGRQAMGPESVPGVSASKVTKAQAQGPYETVYRGEGGGTGSGNYYTPDKEFAREFTRSGVDSEIKTSQVKTSDVWTPEVLPMAVSEDDLTRAIAEAKRRGYKAVRVDEGPGNASSIFIFDKTAIVSTPTPKTTTPGAQVEGVGAKVETPDPPNLTVLDNTKEPSPSAGASQLAVKEGNVIPTATRHEMYKQNDVWHIAQHPVLKQMVETMEKGSDDHAFAVEALALTEGRLRAGTSEAARNYVKTQMQGVPPTMPVDEALRLSIENAEAAKRANIGPIVSRGTMGGTRLTREEIAQKHIPEIDYIGIKLSEAYDKIANAGTTNNVKAYTPKARALEAGVKEYLEKIDNADEALILWQEYTNATNRLASAESRHTFGARSKIADRMWDRVERLRRDDKTTTDANPRAGAIGNSDIRIVSPANMPDERLGGVGDGNSYATGAPTQRTAADIPDESRLDGGTSAQGVGNSESATTRTAQESQSVAGDRSASIERDLTAVLPKDHAVRRVIATESGYHLVDVRRTLTNGGYVDTRIKVSADGTVNHVSSQHWYKTAAMRSWDQKNTAKPKWVERAEAHGYQEPGPLAPDASTAETGPSDFYTEGGGTTPPVDPPITANGAPGGNSGTPNPNNGKSTIDDIPKFSGGPDVPQPDLFAPEVTKTVKAKANRWKILDAVGRDAQLANPMGRLLDLASNTARIAGGAAESTLRNVVSVAQRLAAKGDTYLVSEHPMWGTKFKRVYGGQKASPLNARMRSDLKYGHATYGKGGPFSKLAGIGDVPFREYHYRSMLSDVADNFVRGSGRKGFSNPSKMNSEQVFQSLLKGEAVPGLDVQGMREAAEAYAAHMTYNADNLASTMIKSVEGALDNAAATSTSAVSAGTTNAAHYLIFKPMTRYSKVIGNVAIDRFQRSFFGVPALAEAVAKSTIKGGKPLTPYQARYVTNLVGKGGAAAGISALGVIAVQNGWVKPKIMKTENGTVFVDWGDWEQIGGPAHPFMYAATMAAIDKSSLTDNQKQDAKYKYATNMLLNQPAVTGPQRALRATESPEGVIDYMANFAASMVIPGGMRDVAERLDEYNQSQAAPYDQAVPRNRKAKGPLSQVQKKVPVWREQLPIKTDKRVPN